MWWRTFIARRRRRRPRERTTDRPASRTDRWEAAGRRDDGTVDRLKEWLRRGTLLAARVSLRRGRLLDAPAREHRPSAASSVSMLRAAEPRRRATSRTTAAGAASAHRRPAGAMELAGRCASRFREAALLEAVAQRRVERSPARSRRARPGRRSISAAAAAVPAHRPELRLRAGGSVGHIAGVSTSSTRSPGRRSMLTTDDYADGRA